MNIAQKDLLALRQAAIERYNDFYTAAGKLRETDAFYQWVLDKLPTRHGKLLDVACGEGHMVRLAHRHGLVQLWRRFFIPGNVVGSAHPRQIMWSPWPTAKSCLSTPTLLTM